MLSFAFGHKHGLGSIVVKETGQSRFSPSSARGNTIAYVYDPLGQRASKTVSSTLTAYVDSAYSTTGDRGEYDFSSISADDALGNWQEPGCRCYELVQLFQRHFNNIVERSALMAYIK